MNTEIDLNINLLFKNLDLINNKKKISFSNYVQVKFICNECKSILTEEDKINHFCESNYDEILYIDDDYLFHVDE